MEKKAFLESIRACRRRLNTRDFLNKLVFSLGVGAVAGVLLQVLAFLVPLYYVNLYALLALLLAGITAFIPALLKRNSMAQAALVMDSFGFQERIVTAYEHLEEDDDIYRLQRQDAMSCLEAGRERIKIPLLPPWKKLAGLLGLFVLLLVLALTPSSVKDEAKLLHEIAEAAEEKLEEISEVEGALEALKQEAIAEETMTLEQLAALQEMIESLQSSREEFDRAATSGELTSATQKLEYKYEDMSTQLSALADSLADGATASALSAQAVEELAADLREMSGSDATGQLASNQSTGDGQSGNGQNGQSGNGQSGDGQNGQSGDGQSGDGQNGQSGNGQSGDGGNTGQSGDGDSSGNGQSNGRGTGSTEIPRDYVSVPNATADSESLTGNATDSDSSGYFKAQNGLSWEGERVSYESVIGSYEQNAYEGIAAGQYPSGMEDVIKEYFSSFN